MKLSTSNKGFLALIADAISKIRREITEFLEETSKDAMTKSNAGEFCLDDSILLENSENALTKSNTDDFSWDDSVLSEMNFGEALTKSSTDEFCWDNSVFDAAMSFSPTKPPRQDDSVIDVTGNSYKIVAAVQKEEIKESELKVPFWAHQYIYSFSALDDATREQREFYYKFKKCVLSGEIVDLGDNSNYAFILLYDLLEDYDNHQNIVNLENQLRILGQFYPKTKSYGVNFLARLMEREGDYESAWRVRLHYQNEYYDYWKFGNQYKTKLNLTDAEVKTLNKISPPNNNFCGIEFCRLEIIKLYLSAIKELNDNYILEETSLDGEIEIVADLVARKEFRYRYNSQNYRYCLESTANEIYSNIFKHCENAVREIYWHKRKLSADAVYKNQQVKTEYQMRIGEKAAKIIADLSPRVAAPDEATDIELYAQNATRWKMKFGELTDNFAGDSKRFVEDVLQLAKLNRKNAAVENIFYEASKFVAKSDREAALTLYLYYLYHDLKSATFDNKKLTKTIQKSLFKTNAQLHAFETIVGELIKDRNLEKALAAISKIYAVKRKKILLNNDLIKEVQQQHTGTVELLNEFLQDEYENETTIITARETNDDEIKMEITRKAEAVSDLKLINEITLTPVHAATLAFFYKNNLSVSHGDLENFAKSEGAFKNQLIDSLNEACYEFFDDVLIEEDGDFYTINENYYRQLIAQ